MTLGLGLGFGPKRRAGVAGAASAGALVVGDVVLPPGAIIDDGGFISPPVVTTAGGNVVFSGRKASGSTGKFIYNIGIPAASKSYTLRYRPHFEALANQGRSAFVGFGVKKSNDFRLSGLKGDGASGLLAYEIAGDNTWNKTSGFTLTDGGVAAAGSQAGPNWVRFTTASDNSTYTLSTSADGVTWVEEFTAVVASPIGDLDLVTQFGIAVFLDANDAGSFSVDVELWTESAAESAAPKVLTFRDHAIDATDAATYTYSNKNIGTAAADRIVLVGILGGSTTARTISSVTIGGIAATVRHTQNEGVHTAALYEATVPTGTTATIVVNWSGAHNRCAIVWWTATGLTSGVPVDTDGGWIRAAGATVINLTTVAGGFVIGFAVHPNPLSGSITWSTLTEEFADQVFEFAAARYSGASVATSGSSLTISPSVGNTNSDSPFVVASF